VISNGKQVGWLKVGEAEGVAGAVDEDVGGEAVAVFAENGGFFDNLDVFLEEEGLKESLLGEEICWFSFNFNPPPLTVTAIIPLAIKFAKASFTVGCC
jgi:hypothetical protein